MRLEFPLKGTEFSIHLPVEYIHCVESTVTHKINPLSNLAGMSEMVAPAPIQMHQCGFPFSLQYETLGATSEATKSIAADPLHRDVHHSQ